MLPCVCSVITDDVNCGKNKNVAHEAIAESVTDVLTTV